MAGGYPKIGVWWDLNTCPVPVGLDPRCVRPCIESALRKLYGPRPVTIFAIGNLEYVDPKLLKAISSSGILIRHAPLGGASLSLLLRQWQRTNRPPRKILLISGDIAWFNRYTEESGYNVLRAFPKCLPFFPDYPCVKEGDWRFAVKEWDWETLLQGNSRGVDESLLTVGKGEHAWFCQLCETPSENCDTFIDHLKSEEHRKHLFLRVKTKRSFHLCKCCKYPGHDDYCLHIHYNSDEHKKNMSSSRCQLRRRELEKENVLTCQTSTSGRQTRRLQSPMGSSSAVILLWLMVFLCIVI